MCDVIFAPSILLVEDSPDDAYFFQRALRKGGISCDLKHVLNGREALDYLDAASAASSLPDVVFLDLKMPVMNGFEVLESLQSRSFGSTLRVFVLSGSNQLDDRKRAQALGASDYMVKPITVEDLAKRLDSLKTVEGLSV